ncbi:hypothetical protein L9F63_008537, partial [Diploptera punctata]
MYIPYEGQDLSPEEASKNGELVKRMEGVVMQWTRQIRVALGDQSQPNIAELLCPIDEYEFWIYRYKNLAGLDFQLKNKQLKHICDILLMSQSAYIRSFLNLANEIEEGMKQAKSNIEFLQIVKEPCSDLEKTISPTEIPEVVPALLQCVRTIWMNSPYYNTKERLTILCRAVSNQVILQCIRSVNLNYIFEGNTRAGIRISQFHTTNSDVPWDLDVGPIFNHVDSFVQRCRDMIEVCEAMITFGRMDDAENIPKPRFSGTRGEEFEKICEKIEKDFRCHLKEIQNIQTTILDVKIPSWYDDIFRFRIQMKELEVIIENLIVAVFEQVDNVEEGVQALQAVFHYAKRDTIRPLFDRKTVEVYKMFGEEILETKKDMVEEHLNLLPGLPHFSGRATITRLKKNRLMQLMKILDDAKWLPPCGMGDEVRIQYDKLLITMEESVKNLYRKWQDTLEENIQSRLDKPLLVKSHYKPGLLESNFDRVLLNVCREAEYWQRLKFEVPTVISTVYNKWSSLKLLYERVLTVVMDYNRVIEALSSEERVLFKELIKVCDKKINPGLNKLKWNSDVSDLYISDCVIYTAELDDTIQDFKNCNLEIVSICEKIADTPLFYIESAHVYDLMELDTHLVKCRDEALIKILKFYDDIMECMSVVHEAFENYIELMGTHWALYIHKIDSLVEEAFKLCVRSSLYMMYEILHGDGTSAPSQLIKIHAIMENYKLVFEPQLSDVATLLSHVLVGLVQIFSGIPRLVEKFHVAHFDLGAFWAVIERDGECNRLMDMINE